MYHELVPENVSKVLALMIPHHMVFVSKKDGLPHIIITTDHSTAEIYLHGAHVTQFQKNGEPPLLFMSEASQFVADKPIRGGVPVIFPWFGPREGAPAHGFARLVAWDLAKTELIASSAVKLVFNLSESVLKANNIQAQVSFTVTVGETLTMELAVTNRSAGDLVFEDCLHTYFAVGDIADVSVAGLKGHTYLDNTEKLAPKQETADAIRVGSEVDRVYVNATGTTEIHDAKLRRTIVIEKSGSASTVVWNPWVAKANAMADFGDEEYHRMICVESGNVKQNKISLAAGKTSNLKVVVSSRKA